LKEDKVADLPNTAEAKHPEQKKHFKKGTFFVMDEKHKSFPFKTDLIRIKTLEFLF